MKEIGIDIEGVSKRFGKTIAVDNVSLKIYRGELFSILGPNGAGKTTLMNMIVGIFPPDSGRISVLGMDISKDIDEIKKVIGYIPQENILYDKLTVYENMMFYAGLYDIPGGKAKEKVMKLLDFVGLKDSIKKRAKNLSGGMRKRLNIAIGLINDPEILVLDEPTTGLDPNARRNIWDLLRFLKKEGKTVIMATHYMEEADELSDRVAIMDYGKVIALDTPDNLKKHFGPKTVLEISFYKSVSNMEEEFKNFSINGRIIMYNDSLKLYVEDADIVLPQIVEKSLKIGAKIKRIEIKEPTLEDVFIKLTGRRLDQHEV